MSSKSKKLRFISLFIDYASAISLIALLFLFWHLGKGPVEVNFLRPYIIQALTNETSSYELSVGAVNLELVHSVQPVRVSAKDVKFIDNDGEYVVHAPRLALDFSARALLKGMLAPSSIEIDNPKIDIVAKYGVDVAVDEAENNKVKDINLKKLEFYFAQFEDFMERFNSPEKMYLESFINEIKISNGTVVVDEVDMNRKVTLVGMDFGFERRLTDILLKAESAVEFEDRTAAIDMGLKYNIFNDEMKYTLGFSDLVITDLYDIFVQDKKAVRAVDIPVNGRVVALIDFGQVLRDKENFAENLGKNIKEVDFKIDGGKGQIAFGDSEEFDYDVSSFSLGGQLTGEHDKVKIEDAVFDFDGKQAKLGLMAEGFKDYFFKGDLNNLKISFNADLGSFDLDELSKLWPKYLGKKAWEWCKEGLYGGEISNGQFVFDFGFDEEAKSFGLVKLYGSADVKDANLHYLEGMPVITNVYGRAIFEQDKIEIKADKGVSDGVILNGGTVLLYDLDKDDNFIKIDLTGYSTITNALKLIDNDPLNFTREMGVNPDEGAGEVDIGLKLDFELKSNLKPSEIKVEVLGDLSQVEYLGLKSGKTFVADKLKLAVSENGYVLSGVAKYDGIPLDLKISDNFKDEKSNSKVVASVKIDNKVLKKLGVESEILQAPYFVGEADVNAVLDFLKSGEIDLFIDASLKDVAMDYAFLGFVKNKGYPARAKVKMLIADNKIKDISDFSLIKAQFNAKGNMKTDVNGRLKLIDVTEIKAPKTFAKAKINFGYEPKLNLKVTVTGDSYDLTEFFDFRKSDTKEKKKQKKSLKDPLEDLMDMDIVVGVNKLWTNKNVPVSNFAGKLVIKNGVGVHQLNLVGNYGSSNDVKMKLDFAPRGEEYMLTIDSNNAGSTLKVLRLYENMKGGNLRIEAKRDKYKNIRGHAKMWDFSLVNTPVCAKVLSLASFRGIVDMLSGEGLTFSHLNAPFSYTFSTKYLATEGARLVGSVLGATMSGEYNLVDGDISAKGMVIPAYGLNKFIGNIPLVGKVLAGKDGTVFGTNYVISGSVDKPDVSINTLSTLAPNSVKELFSGE